MSTKVRLTDAIVWPAHNSLPAAQDKTNWPFYRGKEIIIGAPEHPSQYWTCDTDVVWPVLAMVDPELSCAPSEADTYVCVCRHQIQAGDLMNIEFTVYATPTPQGSMKAFIPKTGKMAGKAVLTSDNPRLKSFRQEVASAALNARQTLGMGTVVFGRHVAVGMRVNFYFARPKSAPKSRLHPVVPPDLDKLFRSIGDALKGIVWEDDAQVVWASVHKHYGLPERVEIQVMEGAG